MVIFKQNSVLTVFRQGIIALRCNPSYRQGYERNSVTSAPFWNSQARNYSAPPGTPGSGAGKGGGAGGSVRESGGGLGKYGAAQEEGYFYDKQKEQLKNIKKKLKDKPDVSKQDK